MEVVIVDSPSEGGRLAGEAVAALVASRPNAVLGLATGSSPLPLYADLGRRVDAGTISFRAATAFLLDEYVGLAPGHPQSYRTFIATELEALVDFAPGAIRAPEVAIAGPGIQEACARYDAAIAEAGGVDLQILGIGSDGHIGFNEPGSSLGSRTRLKTLTAVTRSDNARFFAAPEEVPHHVVTQGIATILEARHVVLLAFGAAKAAAVAAAVEGPVSAMVPASALQLHPHTTTIVDEDAAADLRLAGYYRETYAAKPAWQGL